MSRCASAFPQAVCLALTATATPRVRQDIKASLGFQDANEFVASFNRENLFIEVLPKTDPAAQTLAFLERFKDQSGIIYCFSRKQVDELAAFLAAKGFSVRPYHAGLDDDERRRNQEAFIRDDVQIIVATIAFGMGINKPNVRFVLHYDLPKSIEGYYQEIGRAGRDGLPAHCLLLYSYCDVAKLRYFIDQKEENERQVAYPAPGCHRPLRREIQLPPQTAADLFRRNLHQRELRRMRQLPERAQSAGRYHHPGPEIPLVRQTHRRTLRRRARDGCAAGLENEKVLKYHHQELSTFGIGKELTRKQWLHIAHQLVQKGLLDQSNDLYRVLRLTPKGSEVLRNREPILGILPLAEATAAARKKVGEIEYDHDLFALLRAKRKELADAANVPPYVIFSDRTLVEIASYYPMTPQQPQAHQRHRPGQVRTLRPDSARPDPGILPGAWAAGEVALTMAEKAEPARQTVSKPRHVIVGEAYNAGQSISALMQQYGVQRGTILDHLATFAQEGNPLRQGDDFLSLLDLPGEQQEAALQAFEQLGSKFLKPVFEQLGGAVTYDDLKILRLHFLSSHK